MSYNTLTTIKTLEAAMLHSVNFCTLERETIIDVINEIKELNDRLTKEHLPSEYKSWEQVWQRRVEMQNEMDQLRKDYNELIYAVGQKFPDESRHLTALRYIREAESKHGDGDCVST